MKCLENVQKLTIKSQKKCLAKLQKSITKKIICPQCVGVFAFDIKVRQSFDGMAFKRY